MYNRGVIKLSLASFDSANAAPLKQHMLQTLQRDKLWLGPAAFFAALAAAIVGAIITGNNIGAVTGSVEAASAESSQVLARISNLFPLGFAFSAGMVSSVNPCGFVMLPAYLGLYMGDRTEGAVPVSFAARFQRAVLIGCTVSAGFVLMFAAVGAPIGLGARGLIGIFPWIGLAIGVALAIAGAYLLSGGNMYFNLAARLSSRIGSPSMTGVRGYFTFGVAYGIASLSCTLPIFLAVIGGAFTAGTFLDSMLQFLLYGLGMGTVILGLTIGMAVFRSAAARALSKVLPYISTASAVLLLLSGTFIVYYWLTIGELLERIRSSF